MCTQDGICSVCGGRGTIWKGREDISPTCWRCGGTGRWRSREGTRRDEQQHAASRATR